MRIVPSPLCFALRLWSEEPQAARHRWKARINAKCVRPDPIPLPGSHSDASEGAVVPYEAEVVRFRSHTAIAQPVTSPIKQPLCNGTDMKFMWRVPVGQLVNGLARRLT